mmetsp:Transcript_10588/g.24705  ORF Transcript_10588/g.24705 Transcript_10588/m.24705 type:complete len:82 (+) Transcript_10588:605-850(+)
MLQGLQDPDACQGASCLPFVHDDTYKDVDAETLLRGHKIDGSSRDGNRSAPLPHKLQVTKPFPPLAETDFSSVVGACLFAC